MGPVRLLSPAVTARIRARLGLDLAITPAARDQELRLSVRYWEGAVEVTGRSGADEIGGLGYLELAGY